MNGKIITRIVMAINNDYYHNVDRIVIILHDGCHTFSLNKINTIGKNSFYQCYCCHLLNNDRFDFVTSLMDTYGGRTFGNIINTDVDHNYINEYRAEAGEKEYGLYLARGELTFFLVERCRCNTQLRYHYYEQDNISYNANQILINKHDNFYCSICHGFVCDSVVHDQIPVKYPSQLSLALNEFPEDIKYVILNFYHLL